MKETKEIKLTTVQEIKSAGGALIGGMLFICLVTIFIYTVGILIITPEYIDFNLNPDKIEYNIPEIKTLDAYAEDNGYSKANAKFYVDKINIDGINRNYTTINNTTLKAYWDYHKYTPIDYETKEVYYKDADILTPTVLDKNRQRNYKETYQVSQDGYETLLFYGFIFSFGVSGILSFDVVKYINAMLQNRYFRLNQLKI